MSSTAAAFFSNKLIYIFSLTWDSQQQGMKNTLMKEIDLDKGLSSMNIPVAKYKIIP